MVIAAITSCTNTSNPSVMLAAGLVAKKAVERGLKVKPWVKTSLAPGSKVVMDYYRDAGLMPYLEKLQFQPGGLRLHHLHRQQRPAAGTPWRRRCSKENLAVAAVLSGNRNFEGRINPQVKANYLASPPLVVAYALAGTMDIDMAHDPLGHGPVGQAGLLARHLADERRSAAHRARIHRPGDVPQRVCQGLRRRRQLAGHADSLRRHLPMGWRIHLHQAAAVLRRHGGPGHPVKDLTGMRALALLGDSVTTDHISPAGSIPQGQPRGPLPDRAGRAAGGFQFLRRAPRQP